MKKNIVWIVLLVIVGAGAFYGGMQFVQARNSVQQRSLQNLQNLSPEERQQALQQFRGSGNFSGGRLGGAGDPNGGSFLNGEIISKDETSITVKLTDGGSKIILLASGTAIGKMTEGTIADLEIGTQVAANGSTNSDGSITAQSIQIRPAMPPQEQDVNNN